MISALIEVILPVFLVLGFGYIAVARGYFSDEALDGLMRFAQNFAIPLLLFRAIATLDLSHGYDAGLFLSYYTGSTIAFALGIAGARLIFARPWTDAVSIGFSALFANSLMLGLAIMERAYGADSLVPNYAIVSIHAPFCYFLGITTMEIVRSSGRGFGRTAVSVARTMFRNNLMLAIGLGFAVNLSGLVIPGAIMEALNMIVRAALPVALFSLGGVLVRYRPEGDMGAVMMVCAISLFIHPGIAWVLSTQVFHLSDGFVKGAVLTAAMAPGVNSYMFANMYGAARRVAATAVLTGTLFSVLSVSLWLTILGV
ncbi:MAG: AEC family transporter [Rhodobacteraceae bacterium]|nr:AEC family transporter [Paracoccaceae bacterium]